MRLLVLVMMALLLGKPALSAGVALVLHNDAYASMSDPRGTDPVLRSMAALEAAGFDTLGGENLTTDQMRAALALARDRIAETAADRVVIVLSGHFAHSLSGSWLLGIEADLPGLALADGAGLRLDTVMEIAALAQEVAQVWLAVPAGREDAGRDLTSGLPARLPVPLGVSVLRGSGLAVRDGINAILRPGALLSEVVDRSRGLRGEGTISPLVPFLPVGFAPVARADRLAFADAQDIGTEDAFRAYLEAFPNGLNAQAARNAIEALRNTPERIEERLALTRDERRAIQRDLVTLGYNTRGIDGLFGPATRGALRSWQERNALDATGFLTREQVLQLAAQAARRTAEIEAEERARREAAERADRDFWDATGAGRDEAGLRAYLSRYPQGIFAGLARERLARIEAEAQAEQRRQDRADWGRAQQLDTVMAYEAYLAVWPSGEFASLARDRLAALGAPEPGPPQPPDPAEQALERDRAEEQALMLTAPTRLLIERRLDSMGLEPGPVDGTFDDSTRAAIASAQAQFGLPITGYVTQELISRMLGSVLRGLFE